MHDVMRRCLWMVLAAAAVICRGGPLSAQVPADAQWHTLQSRHFRVTYHDGLEPLARHAAASAERAHAALARIVERAPDGVIDIVVTDNVDFSNGYATPFPSNRIVLYAKPPVDALELQYTRDWMDLVVVHELTHVFHLDVSGRAGTLVRRVFGRVPLPWPVFNAVATPGWSIEGSAVVVESALTGFGRVRGSYHDMVVRTAVLEDEIDSLDRLGSASTEWPGGAREYIYGSLFLDWLNRRHGDSAISRLIHATASATIPPPLWFGRVAERALGTSFRDAYEQWARELDMRYRLLADSLGARGLTRTTTLTRHRGYAQYPRYSADGLAITYAASDWRTPPQVRVIDAASGTLLWSSRRNTVAPGAWIGDVVIAGDIEYIDQFRIFSDLYRHSATSGDNVTRGARVQEPDAARDGRVVAIQNADGTNRIVILHDGGVRPLVEADPRTHWSLPRFSPDGARIAVGRWQEGGLYSVVVMDTSGTLLWELPPAPGVTAAPAWSPDGRWLLFSSDRSGIPNLYAADVATHGTRLRQVTNVLTGAFFPDVSPDGRDIVFAAYHHEGFRIERMPFDTSAWLQPPAQHAALPAVARGSALAASRSAPAAPATPADTVAGEPRPYRAWRHARPYAWAPALGLQEGDDAFIGVSLFGRDLVGRHEWALALTAAPASGRTEGSLSYRFDGLPTLPIASLHPSIDAALSRDWFRETLSGSAGRPHIDEREDAASIGVSFTRTRWRTVAGFSLSGEAVRLFRTLDNAPGLTLRDATDELYGLRASAFISGYSSPAAAISRQDGALLQVTARRRWEAEPFTRQVEGRPVVFDRGYSELSAWSAAWRSLPLPGFARHVLALRFSALRRDGPNTSRVGLGGVSTTGLQIPGVTTAIAGTSLFLPVRGYERWARAGTRGWSAAAEYRAPIAYTSTSLRPLPVWLDRISGAAFLDAGDAWCDTATRVRLGAAACPGTAPAEPLLAAGAEAVFWLSAWGASVPIRLGAGRPLQQHLPATFWLVAGLSF